MLTHTYQTLNFVTTVNFKLQGQLYKTRQLYKNSIQILCEMSKCPFSEEAWIVSNFNVYY